MDTTFQTEEMDIDEVGHEDEGDKSSESGWRYPSTPDGQVSNKPNSDEMLFGDDDGAMVANRPEPTREHEYDAYPTPGDEFEQKEDDEDSGSNTLPDFTQERITHIPQIQKLYDAYQQGFEHEYTSYESHMTRAQALAVAMLEHYYPKNQGFTVEPCTFNVMAAHGWAFWLHPEPTGAATGPGAAHKKKAASTAPQWEMFSAKYHRILPERIAGYVVYQEHTVIDKDGNEYLQDYPHTYLGIMMDDLQTFNNWVPDRNSTGGVSIPRAELLSYSLGVQAKIRHGYGILLLGPRIEFYDYNNDAQSAMSRIKSENWAIDMRYQTLSMVNVVFKGINERTIIYQDGSVGEGAMKPMT